MRRQKRTRNSSKTAGQKGANVEAPNKLGQTVLWRAIKERRVTIAKLIIEMGANVDATDDYGYTVLMRAAKKGQEAVVKLLTEKGANVEARDDHGQTALAIAEERGRWQLSSCWPLRAAIENGEEDAGLRKLVWKRGVLSCARSKGHSSACDWGFRIVNYRNSKFP